MGAVFNRIWRQMAESGQCDSQDSVQYHRIAELWEDTKEQRIMDFIFEQANVNSTTPDASLGQVDPEQ
jgi:hypothetical protein